MAAVAVSGARVYFRHCYRCHSLLHHAPFVRTGICLVEGAQPDPGAAAQPHESHRVRDRVVCFGSGLELHRRRSSLTAPQADDDEAVVAWFLTKPRGRNDAIYGFTPWV